MGLSKRITFLSERSFSRCAEIIYRSTPDIVPKVATAAWRRNFFGLVARRVDGVYHIQ
jgi:hypothetical protein